MSSNPQQTVYDFDINHKNFNELVILNSYKLPVVVEFLSVSSGICIDMERNLANFARDFAGQFVFAKVDVYEQPELKEQYQIEHLPTLKVFKDGEVIRTETGKMDENEIALLLKDYGVSRASDEMRLQARNMHLQGDTNGAITLLTQAIQQDPSNPRIAMDMVQIMIDVGAIEQATDLFNKLPDKEKSSDAGKALIGQITFINLALETEGKQVLMERLEKDPLDFDAYFDLGLCLVAERDYQASLEALFALLEQEPNYKDGAAHELIITILNMLAPNDPETTKKYRQRLSSNFN